MQQHILKTCAEQVPTGVPLWARANEDRLCAGAPPGWLIADQPPSRPAGHLPLASYLGGWHRLRPQQGCKAQFLVLPGTGKWATSQPWLPGSVVAQAQVTSLPGGPASLQVHALDPCLDLLPPALCALRDCFPCPLVNGGQRKPEPTRSDTGWLLAGRSSGLLWRQGCVSAPPGQETAPGGGQSEASNSCSCTVVNVPLWRHVWGCCPWSVTSPRRMRSRPPATHAVCPFLGHLSRFGSIGVRVDP